MNLLISNDKLEEHKRMIDNAILRARYEAQIAISMRRIFRMVGDYFEVIYADRRAIPNIRHFKDDIASTLKMNYVKISKATKRNLRTRKADDASISRNIDVTISRNIEQRSKKRSEFIITTLEGNLYDDLNEVIIEASAQGIPLSKEKIASETRKKFVRESVSRSNTIGITEFTGMAEGSKFIEAATLQDTGDYNFFKRWRATLDMVTRPAHIFADGQEAALHDTFTVGGERMLHVGDDTMGATIGNLVNCFDDKTEVLTNNGYMYFKDLKGHEKVATFNTKTYEIEYESIFKKIIQHYNGKMIWLKNVTMDFMMTPNHRVFITDGRPHEKKYRNGIKEVKAIELKSRNFIPKGFIWNVPRVETIKIDKAYNAEDFMEFLGWYLSDGNVLQVKNGKWQISISQDSTKSRKTYLRIVELCKKLFPKVWAGNTKIYIPNNELALYLKELGKSYEKYIPQMFKDLHKNALERFLNAYSRGDGYILQAEERFSPRRMFFTSSKRMADDIAELIIKCGKNVSFRHDKAKTIKFINGTYTVKHPCYWIFENNAKWFCITKINEAKYNGNVYCVQTARNGTLNVRRNRKTCWFGNCRCITEYINTKE